MNKLQTATETAIVKTGTSSQQNFLDSLQNVEPLTVALALPAQTFLSLVDLQKVASFEQACTAPSLRIFEKNTDPDTVLASVCAVIRLLDESLNLPRPLSAQQVYELATLWLEENRDESLSDLILFGKLVKSGHFARHYQKKNEFGKLYNLFNAEVFNGMWAQYRDEKINWREQQHQHRKLDAQSEEQNLLGLLKGDPELLGYRDQMLRANARHVLEEPPLPASCAPTTHDDYLSQLRQNVHRLAEAEIESLYQQADAAGFKDITELLVREQHRRLTERA